MGNWRRNGATGDAARRALLGTVGRVPLFLGLAGDDLLRLVEAGETGSFHDGEVILREGSSGACLYVVLDGTVSVQKAVPSTGHGAELARLGAGETFGEMSLIDRQARSATVVAHGPVTLLRVDEATCLKNPVHSACIYRNIARILSQRLRDLDDAFVLARL